MRMTATKRSTRTAAIGHNKRDGTLRVRYRRGGTYLYEDVPADVAEQVITAKSIGRAIDALIKPFYKFRKVAS